MSDHEFPKLPNVFDAMERGDVATVGVWLKHPYIGDAAAMNQVALWLFERVHPVDDVRVQMQPRQVLAHRPVVTPVRATPRASLHEFEQAMNGDNDQRSAWMLEHEDALRALVSEVERLRKAVLNQCGDNLCWVTDPDTAKALPEQEFLESCRRYRNQIASERGEESGLRTIAQLEAEVERWRQLARQTVCTYCGTITEFASVEERASEVGRQKLIDHILTCEKRPEARLLDMVQTLRTLVEHFGGCARCCEEHGDFPESVSCYCQCHHGAKARWVQTLQAAARALFGPAPKQPWDES